MAGYRLPYRGPSVDASFGDQPTADNTTVSFESLEQRLLMSGGQAAMLPVWEGMVTGAARIEMPVVPGLEDDAQTAGASQAVSLPSTIKHMSGHHDGVDSHFTNEVLPHFNVISGTSSNPMFLNQIRASGKIYALHVVNPSDSTSAAQLVSQWRAPFESNVISGGYDAIIIDEIHPETNGSA